MSNTYHDPISLGAPANSAIFNAPLGQLDAQIDTNTSDIATQAALIASIQAGNTAITQLNLGTPTTLTISGGVVTATHSYHLVDTESAAASDDLDTISGGTTGDWLILQTVSSTRVVRLRTTGNIVPANGVAIYMDSTAQMVSLHYDGTKWREETMSIGLVGTYDGVQVNANTIKLPDGVIRTSGQAGNDTPFLSVLPRPDARIFVMEKASAATFESIGMAAGANSGAGAVANANDDTTVFVSQALAASAGTFGGRKSSTFNLFRRAHNPYFCAVIKTGSDITNVRFWVGMCSAQVTNVDTLAASTHFAGVRYSTNAADAGWLAVVNDGSSQNTGATGVGVATSTVYKIEVWATASACYFSVNNSTPISLSSNLPGLSTDLGWTASLITTTATAKLIAVSRVFVGFN